MSETDVLSLMTAQVLGKLQPAEKPISVQVDEARQELRRAETIVADEEQQVRLLEGELEEAEAELRRIDQSTAPDDEW